MDELLQKVAEQRGMPASLVERSAQAKADKTGTTLEAVLRDWAGDDSDPATPDTPSDPDTPPEAESGDASTQADGSRAVSTDHLVQLAADAKQMPPRLILTSAEARSKHSGVPLDEVLAGWAGVDLEELRTRASEIPAPDASTSEPESPEAPVEPDTPAAAEPEPAPAVPVVAAAATALTMDQLLDKVAEVKGMPASLAKRSAEARSKKTGEPVEAVLAEWAGVDAASVSDAPAATEPEPTPAPAAEATAAPVVDVEVAEDDIELIEAENPDAPNTPETQEQPSRKAGGYPIWLAAAFILIPLLAVAYILVSPNGPDCGSGGQLGVDPVSGEAVNCDGSEYGVVAANHFATGGALYQQCVACHSDNGSGGVGPAFTSGAILATFPAGSCSDHVAWVSQGTTGWPESTYGATDKPVGGVGVMPGFGTSLTEEQIAQVSLYEGVAFGGQDLAEAEADCGLVTADDADES
jgi:mono/diheme cytochrome c family protein